MFSSEVLKNRMQTAYFSSLCSSAVFMGCILWGNLKRAEWETGQQCDSVRNGSFRVSEVWDTPVVQISDVTLIFCLSHTVPSFQPDANTTFYLKLRFCHHWLATGHSKHVCCYLFCVFLCVWKTKWELLQIICYSHPRTIWCVWLVCMCDLSIKYI